MRAVADPMIAFVSRLLYVPLPSMADVRLTHSFQSIPPFSLPLSNPTFPLALILYLFTDCPHRSLRRSRPHAHGRRSRLVGRFEHQGQEPPHASVRADVQAEVTFLSLSAFLQGVSSRFSLVSSYARLIHTHNLILQLIPCEVRFFCLKVYRRRTCLYRISNFTVSS
jgi:hypothetical protein